jgi:hypothetical protein
MTSPDSEPQEVFVASRTYESKEVLAVFSTHEKALLFAAGARAAFGNVEIKGIILDNVEQHL